MRNNNRQTQRVSRAEISVLQLALESEALLSAYLLGEANEEERSQVEAAMAQDPSIASTIEELKHAYEEETGAAGEARGSLLTHLAAIVNSVGLPLRLLQANVQMPSPRVATLSGSSQAVVGIELPGGIAKLFSSGSATLKITPENRFTKAQLFWPSVAEGLESDCEIDAIIQRTSSSGSGKPKIVVKNVLPGSWSRNVTVPGHETGDKWTLTVEARERNGLDA